MTTAPNNAKKGFIPVMLTPFKEDGKVDFDGLTRLTEFYLQAGASGLFANCLSSEMYELDEEERLQIIYHVIKVANGTVPVVATGTFGGALPKQADFVKRVHNLGTQAVIIITGLLANADDDNEIFEANADELLHLTGDVPLGFYECPDPYKRVLSAQQLQRFVETGRVIYHKDTSLNLAQIEEKIAVTRNYNFGLYDAYMAHAVNSLKAGSAGLSCIQGNYFPELVVWLCNNYNSSELAGEVDNVQQFFIRNMEVMHAVYPVASKYYLQKRGLEISLFTRRKVGKLSTEDRQGIDNLYTEYNALKSNLGI